MFGFLVLSIASLCPWGFNIHQPTQGQDEIAWRTGKELENFLTQPLSITLTGAPLREELGRFAEQQRVGLFIDRRVDPGTPIELVSKNQTFEQILWQVADENQLGVCRLADFYYLGPPETTDILPMLWQQMVQQRRPLSAQQRRSQPIDWTKKYQLHWDYLSVPDQLMRELSRQHGFSVRLDQMKPPNQDDNWLPHDLWPKISLPDLELEGQIGLLLVGFGFWFERLSSENEISVIPFPAMERGRFEFAAGKTGRQLLNQLKDQFPNCQFSQSGTTIRATGSPQQLRDVRRRLTEIAEPAIPASGRTVFSLKIKASRGNILASVAQQTGRRFEYDPSLSDELAEYIELSVQEIELEELIIEVLKGTGMKYQIDDKQLVIR